MGREEKKKAHLCLLQWRQRSCIAFRNAGVAAAGLTARTALLTASGKRKHVGCAAKSRAVGLPIVPLSHVWMCNQMSS